ncbi:hypothetical protein Tco_0727365 [Tanacetum coccineum]|uniref:MAK10-like protein n=1 Tax=Tanacetum coccineum TaxID=301880 RepID=A0ABQ4YI85_9ASTR
MGDENHIRTLGDYSKPSHEGYRNTIELPVGNNVVPLRSDTVRFVQNGCSFHRLRSKLRDLNAEESWALLEDLALYENESWNDPKDFAKPVKAITLPQDVPNTSDRHLVELENQVQRLMEAHLAPTQPTQPLSNTHPRTCPNPQPRALDTTFEARVRDYMAAHTERMERLENTIFKQREEINGRMTEMFGLLKDLTTSRTPEKLIREEAKFPVTKNVNSISLARNKYEENNKMDETPDNTKMPTEMEMPVRKAEAMNGSENGTGNEPVKTLEMMKSLKHLVLSLLRIT